MRKEFEAQQFIPKEKEIYLQLDDARWKVFSMENIAIGEKFLIIDKKDNIFILKKKNN